MFRWANPTGQMQGKFINWTNDDTASFQKLLTQNGQVCILVETKINDDDPYGFEKVSGNIITALGKLEYVEGHEYIIMQLPNITEKYNA